MLLIKWFCARVCSVVHSVLTGAPSALPDGRTTEARARSPPPCRPRRLLPRNPSSWGTTSTSTAPRPRNPRRGALNNNSNNIIYSIPLHMGLSLSQTNDCCSRYTARMHLHLENGICTYTLKDEVERFPRQLVLFTMQGGQHAAIQCKQHLKS